MILFTTVLLVTLLTACPSSSWAGEEDATITSAANDPEWLALLHYHSSIAALSGRYSLVDDDRFFLSPNGKSDPVAELVFNLNAIKHDRDGYGCRFPLRASFLTRKFGLHRSSSECTVLESWLGNINATHVTLVFPSSYLNNPASAFGHTLLKVSPPPGSSSDLLSYAINYAAATMGEDPLSYALKGIFGGYNGFYTIEPYYEKVKKYSNAENRDLWEYPLNFSAAEVRRLLLHTWELRDVNLDYFYFDENCSFFLLELLQVVRPGINLSYTTPPWVVPATTIRVVREQAMTNGQQFYRPSSLRSLRSKLRELSEDERLLARKVASADYKEERVALLDSLPEPRRPYVMDVAIEYLAYRQPEFTQRRYDLILERSSLSNSNFQSVPTPPNDPLRGHRELRLGIAQGIVDGEGFSDLRFRPVSHDLFDSPVGYELGSQIELLDTSLRTFADGDVELNRLKLLDIRSLSPRDALIRPKSWSLTLAYESLSPEFGVHDSSLYLEGGVGATTDPNPTTLLYGLIGPRVEFDSFRAGPALEVGAIYYIDGNSLQKVGAAVGLVGRTSYLYGREHFDYSQLGFTVAIFPWQHASIKLENFLRHRYHEESHETLLSILLHF